MVHSEIFSRKKVAPPGKRWQLKAFRRGFVEIRLEEVAMKLIIIVSYTFQYRDRRRGQLGALIASGVWVSHAFAQVTNPCALHGGTSSGGSGSI